MPWNIQTATTRIRDAIIEAPKIKFRTFADDYIFQFAEMRETNPASKQTAKPLFGLPRDEAIAADTIQIYINIVNYDEYRLEEGQETHNSHKKALEFLHLYYSACDRLADKGAVMRVDFHGSRMHAVIIDEEGGGLTQAHVAEAFQFVEDFRLVAQQANREFKNEEFTAEFRFGIDAGRCIAISNGQGDDAEPLFLGSAANHAAKLASGSQAGVYISDRVRALLNHEFVYNQDTNVAVAQRVVESIIQTSGRRDMPDIDQVDRFERIDTIMESWKSDREVRMAESFTDPTFSFHYMQPPLSKIDYKRLMPSYSIRMPVVSIFADIDGYTHYIDTAIQKRDVDDAVRALYVIREELVSVVQEDFSGRKVRLIGDCIHAVVAEGDAAEVDDRKTVKTGAELAGALRSSFLVCQNELLGIDELGLAIGVEYGVTPITRLGIRGERSVRVASSGTTITSEKCQRDCDGTQTKFGDNARSLLPVGITGIIIDGTVSNADYSDFVTASGIGSPSVHIAANNDPMNQPGRAYMEA